MDPHHRLLLECAVEAFDDAGIDPGAWSGSSAAVFMGVSSLGYKQLQQLQPNSTNAYTMTGGVANSANRISHAFDLRGPSMAVDTACASSLTALHQACEVLRTGAAGLALAGGANVLLTPGDYVGFAKASMLSPSGRCRTFSSHADGFVRAEGAGVLILKRLSDALADGDRVHGVVVATGVNTAGRTQGLSLPSVDAQEALLREVYGRSGLNPDDVVYVEAHGTGTAAGDPVECAALGRVLGTARSAGAALPVGSVKTNMGHLEQASGVAGVLKSLLVLRHGVIPASLHGEPVSADIDFSGLRLEPVPRARPVRRASTGRAFVGVNSFGFGGANAHVVVGESPAPASSRPRSPAVSGGRLPVMVSARTPSALIRAAESMAARLETMAGEEFYDLAWTTCRRRALHGERVAVLASSPEEAARALRTFAAADTGPARAATALSRRRVGFVLCGNGSQWNAMGVELVATEPAFREAVEQVDRALTPLLGWSVLDRLAEPVDARRLAMTEVAQPLLFAVQVGVMAALARRGVSPAAVAGHSVGEIAAAFAAGALDVGQAARVVVERSRAQALTAGTGRMAAVGLGAGRMRELLSARGGRVQLAAVNTVKDVTVSGDAAALEELYAELAAEGVFFRELDVDYPFHSAAMDRLRVPLRARLADLKPGRTRIPFVSTVSGATTEGTDLDGEYWWRNVREPVLFADAVDSLLDEWGCGAIVDVGPHAVLAGYVRRQAAARGRDVAAVSTLSRSEATSAALDATAAHLLAAGADVDWRVFFPRPGRVVDLPAYPWERERHWNGEPSWWPTAGFEPQIGGGGVGEDADHPLLGVRVPIAEPAWLNVVEPARLPWLGDHKVGTEVVVPGTAYVELALAAGHRVFESVPVELDGLDVDAALVLPWDDPTMDVRVQTSLSERDGRVVVSARRGPGGAWQTHARARVRRLVGVMPAPLDLDAVRRRMSGHLDADGHRRMLAKSNLPYGPAFRTLTELWTAPGEVLAAYTATVPGDAYRAHPTVIDGALQASASLWTHISDTEPFVPTRIESIRPWQVPATSGFVHVRRRTADSRQGVIDVTITDPLGGIAWELSGCVLRRVRRAKGAGHVVLTTRLRAASLPAPAPVVPTPAPLPAPNAVLAACAVELKERASRAATGTLDTAPARMRELAAHLTAAAITEIRRDAPGGETRDFGVEDLIGAGVKPKYTRLLDLLVDGAVRQGLLRPSRSPQTRRWLPGTAAEPARVFAAAVRDLPSFADAFTLLGVCGRNLPEVLRGRCDPTDLLFSDGDRLAERFYDLLRPYNEAASLLLRTAVSAWPDGRPLRILEVGAGTGGMTAELLRHLPPERTQYVFTDVSPRFLPPARHKLAAYDFVDYRTLDLDRDAREQGFAHGSFDVVLAANSLHTAKDLAASLRQVADLLVDDGHLLAIEGQETDASLLIFGLLDSFWTSTDTRLRPETAWLPGDRWPSLLRRSGFSDVAQPAAEHTPDHGSNTVLLAARSSRELPVAARAAGGGEHTSWLLAAEPVGAPDAERLAAALTHDGCTVRTATLGTETDWGRLVSPDARHAHVVLLWGGVADGPDTATAQAHVAHAASRISIVRSLARACQGLPEHVEATVWIVVSDPAPGPMALPPSACPADSAVWGAARALGNEQRRIAVKRVSLLHACPESAADLVRALVDELRAGSPEDEVVLTPQGRFVARVLELPEPSRSVNPAAETAYGLRVRDVGMSYRVDWQEEAPPVPGAGEVGIRVRAGSVNYRDALSAMGMVPPVHERDGLPRLGLECAGVVTTCGPKVADFAPGDRVFAVAPAALGSHVSARADMVARIPAGMSFTDAATLPVVFLTAHYALDDLARLRPGETLLVHSAAGGVGLAALQVAHARGARVIATAGTDAKRTLLRLLGVEHVLDSRTLAFADRVRAITEGRGVDVVLNSLSGEAQIRSLELLAAGGRFVELGKRDFLGDAALPTRPFLRNLAFYGADVSPLLDGHSLAGAALFREVARLVHEGVYRPLIHHAYSAHRIAEALDHLGHSRHTGKIVLAFDEPVAVRSRRTRPTLDPDATYLVTGGLGGFGAATACWLADRGARRLALVGRRGTTTPEATTLLADLAARGVTATAYAADAADTTAMRRVLETVDATGFPLRGVVHAAMVMDDGPLDDLTDARDRSVLRPKLGGGHVLDVLTRGRSLDFFVVYSSTAALIGNRHQTNYCAANTALEALVHQRKAAGEPALAIQWGLIGDVGYVAREDMIQSLERRGHAVMTAAAAFDTLADLLDRPDLDVVAVSGPLDWERMRRSSHAIDIPRLAALVPGTDARSPGGDPRRLRETLAALDADQVRHRALKILADTLAGVLKIPVERLLRCDRLADLGIDSLMATELAVAVERTFGCTITAITLLNSPTLADLASRILVHLDITFPDPVGPMVRQRTTDAREAPGRAGPPVVMPASG